MEIKKENIIIDPSQLYQTIFPDLFVMNGCNSSPKTYKGTNIFFLGASHDRIMIDAGDPIPEFENNFNELIIKLNITITSIIITHFHHDHCEGLIYVLKRFPSIKIYKFKGEGEILKYDENLEKQYGFKYNYIQDQEILKLNEYELQILHIPGHSDDSIGVYDGSNMRFFSGDTILGNGTGTSVSDLVLYLTSIKKILELSINCLLPGHGDIILQKEKVKAHLLAFQENRLKREESILVAMETKKSMEFEDLFNEVYKIVPPNLIMVAKDNLRVHLNKLIAEDIIFKTMVDGKTLYNYKK